MPATLHACQMGLQGRVCKGAHVHQGLRSLPCASQVIGEKECMRPPGVLFQRNMCALVRRRWEPL